MKARMDFEKAAFLDKEMREQPWFEYKYKLQ